LSRHDLLVAAVFVAGLAAFAAGVALIFLPAGVMVAGASAAGGALLYVRGGGSR
jgi:hypothetical protein